jgi:hypothetical protein
MDSVNEAYQLELNRILNLLSAEEQADFEAAIRSIEQAPTPAAYNAARAALHHAMEAADS